MDADILIIEGLILTIPHIVTYEQARASVLDWLDKLPPDTLDVQMRD